MRLLWFLLVCLLGSVALAQEPTRGPRSVDEPAERPGPIQPYREQHALIIGIDDYAEEGLQLDYAVEDAEGVIEVLEQRFDYRIDVLRNEEATREGVLVKLAEYSRLHPEDALLIFWAGHGMSETVSGDETLGYLVPHDGTADPDRMPARNISMNQLREIVGKRIPAKHKLLIADACYAGILAEKKRDASLPRHDEAYIRSATSEPTFQVITAGRADQQVLDAGAGSHSVFTGELIEALGRIDDWSSAKALYAEIEPRVRNAAFDKGGEHQQTPMFGTLVGLGDYILLPNRDQTPDPREQYASRLEARLRGLSGCALAGRPEAMARLQDQFRDSSRLLTEALDARDEPRAELEHQWQLGVGALLEQIGCGSP